MAIWPRDRLSFRVPASRRPIPFSFFLFALTNPVPLPRHESLNEDKRTANSNTRSGHRSAKGNASNLHLLVVATSRNSSPFSYLFLYFFFRFFFHRAITFSHEKEGGASSYRSPEYFIIIFEEAHPFHFFRRSFQRRAACARKIERSRMHAIRVER